MYHRWPRRIGAVDVCLVQPPARENRIREPHYQTYPGLARLLLADGLSDYLDKPYAFFGHCGGALPGVELAWQIAAAGLPAPRRLFVSSQVAPHDGPAGRFLTLQRDELAEELRRLIESLGGKPSPQLVELGLALLEADLAANRSYLVPRPRPLPCGVTVIGWTDDAEIPMAAMGGWRDLAGDCRYTLLPGGHYTFLDAPAALLAELARGLLDVPIGDRT